MLCYWTFPWTCAVKWGNNVQLHLHRHTHTHYATLLDVRLHLHTHTRHATLLDVLLHLRTHTHVMLRYWTFSCACTRTHTHTRCATLLDVLVHLHTQYIIYNIYVNIFHHVHSFQWRWKNQMTYDDLLEVTLRDWGPLEPHRLSWKSLPYEISWDGSKALPLSTRAKMMEGLSRQELQTLVWRLPFSTKDYCFVMARIILWHNNADSKHSAGIDMMPICTQYANMQRLSELINIFRNMYILGHDFPACLTPAVSFWCRSTIPSIAPRVACSAWSPMTSTF